MSSKRIISFQVFLTISLFLIFACSYFRYQDAPEGGVLSTEERYEAQDRIDPPSEIQEFVNGTAHPPAVPLFDRAGIHAAYSFASPQLTTPVLSILRC